MAKNLLWQSETPENLASHDVVIASGKLHLWEGLITANPFYLLPGKNPEKSIWMFYWQDVDAGIGCSAAKKKEWGLDANWKPDECHWFLIEIPLVESGKGDWHKPASVQGKFLLKVLNLETPYNISFRWNQDERNFLKVLEGKYQIGPSAGKPLDDASIQQCIFEMVDFVDLNVTNTPYTAPSTELLTAVRAYIQEQKVPGEWAGSKAETLSEKIDFRIKFLLENDARLEAIGQIQAKYELNLAEALLIILA